MQWTNKFNKHRTESHSSNIKKNKHLHQPSYINLRRKAYKTFFLKTKNIKTIQLFDTISRCIKTKKSLRLNFSSFWKHFCILIQFETTQLKLTIHIVLVPGTEKRCTKHARRFVHWYFALVLCTDTVYSYCVLVLILKTYVPWRKSSKKNVWLNLSGFKSYEKDVWLIVP